MAISKAKIREMRENSAAGAAKQRAKEQAELDKYMYRRNTEVANMLSTNEKIALVAQGRKDGLSISQIAAKHDIPAGSVSRYISMAKTMGLIPSDGEDKPVTEQPGGVIDAAELTPDERAEIIAQAERDAGIVPENEPDEPAGADVSGIAAGIMAAVRKAVKVPREVEVELKVTDGFYELEVTDAFDENITATFTWR